MKSNLIFKLNVYQAWRYQRRILWNVNKSVLQMRAPFSSMRGVGNKEEKSANYKYGITSCPNGRSYENYLFNNKTGRYQQTTWLFIECINDETSRSKTKRWFTLDYVQLITCIYILNLDSSNNFEVEKAKYWDRLHIRSGCTLHHTTNSN